MELSGHSRPQGQEIRWQSCPSCGHAKWAVSQNGDTGAWICYACGAKGAVDMGHSVSSLMQKLTPTVGKVRWPEVTLPEWMPLTRTGRKYLRERGILRPEDFGIVEIAGGGRVLIPYIGPDGAIIYWVTRSFVPDGLPKYVGAPGRKPLYILPNWEVQDETVFVEGPFDCIVHHLATGIPTIGLGGKSLPAYNLGDVTRLARGKRTLMLDHDALRATLTLSQQLEAQVAHLPDGLDPADYNKREAMCET